MKRLLVAVLMIPVIAGPALAQVVPPPAKSDRTPVEHGAQPNAGEVRPGTAEGDSPSASAGNVVTRQERRILGLPVTTALLLAGLILALFIVAGVVIPSANRRRRARGGGVYGE